MIEPMTEAADDKEEFTDTLADEALDRSTSFVACPDCVCLLSKN